MFRSGRFIALLALGGLLLVAMPVQADGESDCWWWLGSQSWDWAAGKADTPYAISVFGGVGTERNLSDTLENLHRFDGYSDRMPALSGTREIAWFRNQLSIEGELMYAYH